MSRPVIDGVCAQVPEGVPVSTVPRSPIPHFLTGRARPTPCDDTRCRPPGPVAGTELMARYHAAQGEWAVDLPDTGRAQ